jgi:NAD(P)-dependent dehydrogenase (short-subunit alcohol dehydrogenase family)
MYLEKFRLDRKTALVTGGGQGIGLASAEALAEAGAKVVIADRDLKVAHDGLASMKAKGLDAEVVAMDVTDSKRVSEVADELVSRFGRIDILVNNAGIARSIGSMSSTSISTARSGVAAPSASTCCRRSPVPL